NRNRGIRLRGLVPEVVELGNGISESDLVVHDECDSTMAALLSRLGPPDFPTPIGILRAVERPTYEDGANAQIAAARERSPADLASLLRRGETGVVRGPDTTAPLPPSVSAEGAPGWITTTSCATCPGRSRADSSWPPCA